MIIALRSKIKRGLWAYNPFSLADLADDGEPCRWELAPYHSVVDCRRPNAQSRSDAPLSKLCSNVFCFVHSPTFHNKWITTRPRLVDCKEIHIRWISRP
ncbi:hypothetical protein THS5294_01553 [Thalassobacter stenotrophicus]|uniref:Uncharacterized protein n=2 Tax=Thalassobacter stenotrophicus TaxID=266809 RepID=A0A0P1EYP3_9RHOB|nr:hypothetical protein THS5294_01553 [Thalassobacter stenotrophicus]SHI71474.1 hypothetical protein SAMN02744035_01344 [Thalassobacter stenotrophicus DSM 16310]